MKQFNLTKRVSVITGAAGGIGRQVAYTFAAHGSDVVVIDINEKEGKEVASGIEKKHRVKALFIPCDITDYDKVSAAAGKIIKEFKRVDNLITAAGYGPDKTPVEELDLSQWKKAIDINLNGTFYIIHALIGQMISQGKANIIIIGSATVLTGSGGGVHYAASKVAQYGIMKGLSYELLSKGIRTNIITPHIIDTPMLRKRYPDSPEVNKKLAARTPIGRIGTPDDIANIALFLASDESGYICGAEIIADGGGIHYRG
jgi:3-oxoacyl-[acyl-carrier protein] reductase